MRDFGDSDFDDDEEDNIHNIHRRQRALGRSNRSTPCSEGGEHECDEDRVCYGCGLMIED